jgi:hypothetical protein
MTRKRIIDLIIFALAVLAIYLSFAIGTVHGSASEYEFPVFHMQTPKPPTMAYEFGIYHDGPFEVAKVFGRSQGCQSADGELIKFTSDTALKAGVDPRIVASIIAVESGCNQFAVSSRGALGLMQVEAGVWKSHFDFGGDVNLLNRQDNIKTGATILARLITQFGTVDGIRRYNGTGVGCDTCDAGYTAKVMAMVGR